MSVLKITSALFYDCRDLKTMQSWVFEWPQWGPTMGRGLGPGSGSSTHSWVVSKTTHYLSCKQVVLNAIRIKCWATDLADQQMKCILSFAELTACRINTQNKRRLCARAMMEKKGESSLQTQLQEHHWTSL